MLSRSYQGGGKCCAIAEIPAIVTEAFDDRLQLIRDVRSTVYVKHECEAY